MKTLLIAAAAATLLIGTGSAMAQNSPGLQMQEKGSVKGSAGASGYAPGHVRTHAKTRVQTTGAAHSEVPGKPGDRMIDTVKNK